MAVFLKDVASVAVDEPEAPTASKRQYVTRRLPRTSLHECAVDLLTMHCDCEVNCFEKIRELPDSANVMSAARVQFVEAGQRGSSEMLFNMLLPMRILIDNKILLQYLICGLVVCADAFFQYFGMYYEDSRVKRVLANIRKGKIPVNCVRQQITNQPTSN